MGEILGIDLGTNSIGWALLVNNKITNYGLQHQTQNQLNQKIRKNEVTINPEIEIRA